MKPHGFKESRGMCLMSFTWTNLLGVAQSRVLSPMRSVYEFAIPSRTWRYDTSVMLAASAQLKFSTRKRWRSFF